MKGNTNTTDLRVAEIEDRVAEIEDSISHSSVGTVTATTNSKYTLKLTNSNLRHSNNLCVLTIEVTVSTPDTSNWVQIGTLSKNTASILMTNISSYTAGKAGLSIRLAQDKIYAYQGSASETYRACIPYFSA